jgi:pyruvate kinase
MQVGVDYYKQFNFIRYWSTKQTTRPLSDMESVMCSAATMAVLYSENTNPNLQGKSARKTSCIACLTESGVPARLIAKYRPPVVVFCISTNEATVRQVRVSHKSNQSYAWTATMEWSCMEAGNDRTAPGARLTYPSTM